jgi:hypothetical protein
MWDLERDCEMAIEAALDRRPINFPKSIYKTAAIRQICSTRQLLGGSRYPGKSQLPSDANPIIVLVTELTMVG